MNRIAVAPRPHWQEIVESQGFDFHTRIDCPYWNESAAYVLTAREVEILERATADLYDLCLEAAQHIIDHNLFSEMRIPEQAIPLITESWQRETPSVYGRFDLAYDGTNPPKLLEFNAQTPTSLLEAAVIQWLWKEDIRPHNDQFNSIEPKLIAQWKECKPFLEPALYFSSLDNAEDSATVTYLASMAEAAGIPCRFITLADLGWLDHCFVDNENRAIRNLFALYPWEWLMAEQGDKIIESFPGLVWIEPPWKMLWSNKALLAVLWKLFPGHPNLLETHLDGAHLMTSYVRKPIFAREGANVKIVDPITTCETGGTYGAEGFVYQQLGNLARFDDKFVILGSWYITDQGAAGIGVRESDTPITGQRSCFVPHYIE